MKAVRTRTDGGTGTGSAAGGDMDGLLGILLALINASTSTGSGASSGVG
ncbi:hypothetical protein ACFVMC_07205 [Nocardia sp. NPDC127579]